MFVPRIVARDGVSVGSQSKKRPKREPEPEVSAEVVEMLQRLLGEARAGRIAAVAIAVLDEEYYPQPACAGDAPASTMAEATRQLHELVARWSTQQTYNHGYRYFSEPE